MIMNPVQTLAEKYSADMKQFRRHIHQHPELGGKEESTIAYIAEKLKEMGLEPNCNYSEHACTALIKGSGQGKVILLRADIDALAIQEDTGLPFASRNDGVMHACGHDCHTASLLGAALILRDLRDQFPGTVKLCFQPAEEVKGLGACNLVEEGVLKDPDVDFVMGIHVTPSLPVGSVSCESGPVTAYPDFFTITIHGKSCHGSAPSTGKDPIRAAVAAYQMINDLSSRIDMLEPHVIQICTFRTDTTATNIVPNTTTIGGTVRTLTPESRQLCISGVEQICRAVESCYGVTCELKGFGPATPPVVNDPGYTPKAKDSVRKIITGDFVAHNADQLGGEDFSFYQQTGIPGFFVRSGAANTDSATHYPLHSAKFCPDEAVIAVDAAMYAQVALDYLKDA